MAWSSSRSSGGATVIMPPATPAGAPGPAWNRLAHVLDIDEGDAPEALGRRSAEVLEPVVVRPEAGGEQIEVGDAEELQSGRGVDDRGPDPVLLVLAQELRRLIGPRPDFGEARGGPELSACSKRLPAWAPP